MEQEYDYEAMRKKRKKAKSIIILIFAAVLVFVNVGIPLIYMFRGKSSKGSDSSKQYGETLSYEAFKEKFDYKFDNLGIFNDAGEAKSFKIVDINKTKNNVSIRRDGNELLLRYRTEKNKETNKVTTTYDFDNGVKERETNDTVYYAYLGKGQNEISRKNNKSKAHTEAFNLFLD